MRSGGSSSPSRARRVSASSLSYSAAAVTSNPNPRRREQQHTTLAAASRRPTNNNTSSHSSNNVAAAVEAINRKSSGDNNNNNYYTKQTTNQRIVSTEWQAADVVPQDYQQYDSSPVDDHGGGGRGRGVDTGDTTTTTTRGEDLRLREDAGGSPLSAGGGTESSYYSVDPWEMSNCGDSVGGIDQELVEAQQNHAAAAILSTGSPESSITSPDSSSGAEDEGYDDNDGFLGLSTFNKNNNSGEKKKKSSPNNNIANDIVAIGAAAVTSDDSSEEDDVFISPEEIHPNMEHCNQQDIEQLRLLAGKLSFDWRTGSGPAGTMAAPALARRIRDFQFAQEKRRKKYGDERPWGILGLYDFLSSIRIDVEWAEDAARRRANGEPYLSWADFDESKKSGKNRPFFTYILLAVCTIMLIASIAVNGWQVEPLDQNPMIGPSAETLIKMGAKDTYLIVVEDEGWRLLSSTVLHAGLVHYFINMLALWFVGGAIETSHGWIAALIIFMISAVGGTILSALFLPEYITVGASGGIFGFIGACLADIIMNWKLLFCDFVTAENGKKQSHIMVVVILIVDILLNSIIGLTPFVDNFTHLGGMVYGFLCGISTMERLSTDFFGMEEGFTTRAKHFFMRFFGLIVSIVSIVVTLVVLLHGDGATTPCPNCTWLSCVTFPPWEEYNNKWWYCDDCGRVTADIVTQPYLHLDLQCPTRSDGQHVVTIDLSEVSYDVSRAVLIKKLPSYCREFCLSGSNITMTTNSTTEGQPN